MFICSESFKKNEGVIFSYFRFMLRFLCMKTRIQLVFRKTTFILFFGQVNKTI